MFWGGHDARDKYKSQYMSAIYYHDPEQKVLAEQSKKDQDAKASVPMATLILPATTFYNAEDYHQKYRFRWNKSLFKQLNLSDEKVITSHIAARINGWCHGFGSQAQIEEEYKQLGLTEEQAKELKHIQSTSSTHC